MIAGSSQRDHGWRFMYVGTEISSEKQQALPLQTTQSIAYNIHKYLTQHNAWTSTDKQL